MQKNRREIICSYKIPDFTIDCQDGSILLWEHLRMMDESKYRDNWKSEKHDMLKIKDISMANFDNDTEFDKCIIFHIRNYHSHFHNVIKLKNYDNPFTYIISRVMAIGI